MTYYGNLDDSAKRLMGDYMDMLMRDRTAYAGRWMAFDLAMGKGSATTYDTAKDARRHHHGPWIFLKLQPSGITERAARAILKFHRGLWDAGIRLSEGDPMPVQTGLNDPGSN